MVDTSVASVSYRRYGRPLLPDPEAQFKSLLMLYRAQLERASEDRPFAEEHDLARLNGDEREREAVRRAFAVLMKLLEANEGASPAFRCVIEAAQVHTPVTEAELGKMAEADRWPEWATSCLGLAAHPLDEVALQAS